jgi:hypothetical protein
MPNFQRSAPYNADNLAFSKTLATADDESLPNKRPKLISLVVREKLYNVGLFRFLIRAARNYGEFFKSSRLIVFG